MDRLVDVLKFIFVVEFSYLLIVTMVSGGRRTNNSGNGLGMVRKVLNIELFRVERFNGVDRGFKFVKCEYQNTHCGTYLCKLVVGCSAE